MAQADFAISRAGATTMWELISNGLPALFIPYPYAIHNHQYYNAQFLLNQHLCYLLPQQKCDKEAIIAIIKELSMPSSKLNDMSIALREMACPNGSANIIDLCLAG